MNYTGLLFFLGYVALFVGTLLAVIWWDRRKRRMRKPFPEDLKLLRMPGEYLWRRVIENDESDMQWWFIIMLVPMLVGAVILGQTLKHFRVKILRCIVWRGA